MSYFWITLQIVGAVLSPLFLVYLTGIVYCAAKYAWREAKDRDIERTLLKPTHPDHWHMIQIEACANPDYIMLIFRHTGTNDRLKISCERSKLVNA